MFVSESSQYPEFHTCNSETVTFRDSGSDTDGFLSPDTGEDNIFRKVRERFVHFLKKCELFATPGIVMWLLKSLFNFIYLVFNFSFFSPRKIYSLLT